MSEYTGTKAESYNFRTFNLNNTNNTGSRDIMPHMIWTLNGDKFILEEHNFSDSLVKIIDEIITNATDTIISPSNGEEYGKRGDRINIDFKDGIITVWNNGPGIPFYKEKNEDIWSIEKIFSREYTSTNYDNKKETFTGGINGVGAKLTNILSDYFYVETVCFKSKRIYKQTFKNNLEIIESPIIAAYTGNPYTKIEFKPTYNILCKKDKLNNSQNWYESNKDLVYKIIERRVWEIATYLNCIVYFNNQRIYTSMSIFTEMHMRPDSIAPLYYDFITPYKIKTAIIIHEPILNRKKYETIGFNHITMMNGVVLTTYGNYIEKLISKIERYILTQPDYTKFTFSKADKKLPTWVFRENITFITIAQYPKLYFDFAGQNKSTLNFSSTALREFDKNYVYDTNFLDTVWNKLKTITVKLGKPVNKNTKAKPKLYEPATCIKEGKQGEALIVVEGDSAATLIRDIFDTNKSIPRKLYGIYSIQGVPINALKHSNKYPQGYLQDEKLKKNDNIQALVNVLGITYTNYLKPKYKKIIFATDQDFDGKGKICSLLICFFMVYFPELVKRDFLYRYRTPIVRVFADKTYEFYSIFEYEEWVKEVNNIRIKDTMYYKGLGTHDEDDRKNMSFKFMNDLVKINYDITGEDLLFKLYDKDTTVRKLLLREHSNRIYKYEDDLNVSITEHCLNESIPEQINNIERMIPNVIDGMVPCQRKIIALLRKSDKILLVSGLSGKAIDKMGYAHGPMALGTAIKNMAQIFVGANRCPLILPVSASIGTQFGGPKDTAQDRYTKIKANPLMKYLYPVEDDDLLELSYGDGTFYEPVYYVPVIPRILLEDYNCIGTGWNCVFTARRFDIVYKYTKYSIQYTPICSNMVGLPELYPNMDIIVQDGREICIGRYHLIKNVIIITQLPLQLWGKKIMKLCDINYEDKKDKNKNSGKKAEKKELSKKYSEVVEDIINLSASKKVEIHIYLKSGAMEKILESAKMPHLDPIIEYFGLYKYLHRNLNFLYGSQLKSYNNLNDIFTDWFIKRRELYEKRIEKNLIKLKYKIIMNEGIYNFVQNDRGQIDDKEDEMRDEILSTTEIKTWRPEWGIKYYFKLNAGPIKGSYRGTAGDLEKAILTDVSYDYIYNIKKSATSKKNIEKHGLYLNTLYEKYKKLECTSWRELWLSELKDYKKKYLFCKSKDWFYKDIKF